MNLGEKLKELRAQKKLNQSDLAKILRVDRSTYGKYETGDSSPDYEKLSLLADYFDVSVDYLLGRTDTPKPLTPEELPETIAFSLPEGYDELTPEGQEKLREFLDLIKLKYRKEKE